MTKLNLSFKSSLLSRSLHESQMNLAINEESSSHEPHATLPSRASTIKSSSIDLQTAETPPYHVINWRRNGAQSATLTSLQSLNRSHSPPTTFSSFRHSSDFSRIVNEHSAHSDKQIYRHTKIFDDEEQCKRNQMNQSNSVGNKQFYHYEGHHLDNNNNNSGDNNNCNDHKNKHDNNNCNGECINGNNSNDNNNHNNGNKNPNNSNNDYVRNMTRRNTLTNLSSTSNDKQGSHSFHPSNVWTSYNVSTASMQPLRLDALSISNSSSRSSSSACSSPVTILSPTASITSNSSSQFLSSHIVQRKRKRTPQPIPEEYKDTAYWERRKRNNESAKRSREIRRVKEQETNIKVTMLERDNLRLKTEVVMLRSELEKLREILYCRERQAN